MGRQMLVLSFIGFFLANISLSFSSYSISSSSFIYVFDALSKYDKCYTNSSGTIHHIYNLKGKDLIKGDLSLDNAGIHLNFYSNMSDNALHQKCIASKYSHTFYFLDDSLLYHYYLPSLNLSLNIDTLQRNKGILVSHVDINVSNYVKIDNLFYYLSQGVSNNVFDIDYLYLSSHKYGISYFSAGRYIFENATLPNFVIQHLKDSNFSLGMALCNTSSNTSYIAISFDRAVSPYYRMLLPTLLNHTTLHPGDHHHFDILIVAYPGENYSYLEEVMREYGCVGYIGKEESKKKRRRRFMLLPVIGGRDIRGLLFANLINSTYYFDDDYVYERFKDKYVYVFGDVRHNYSHALKVDEQDIMNYVVQNNLPIYIYSNKNLLYTSILAYMNKGYVIPHTINYKNTNDLSTLSPQQVLELYKKEMKNKNKNIFTMVAFSPSSPLSYLMPKYVVENNGYPLEYGQESAEAFRESIRKEMNRLSGEGFFWSNPQYVATGPYLILLGNEIPSFILQSPVHKFGNPEESIETDIPYAKLKDGKYYHISVGRIIADNINSDSYIEKAILLGEYRHPKYIDFLNHGGGNGEVLTAWGILKKFNIWVDREVETRVSFYSKDTWNDIKENIHTIVSIIKDIKDHASLAGLSVLEAMKAELDLATTLSYVVCEADLMYFSLDPSSLFHLPPLTYSSFKKIRDYDMFLFAGKSDGSSILLPDNKNHYTLSLSPSTLNFSKFFFIDAGHAKAIAQALASQGAYGIFSDALTHDTYTQEHSEDIINFLFFKHNSLGEAVRDTANIYTVQSNLLYSLLGRKYWLQEAISRQVYGNPLTTLTYPKTPLTFKEKVKRAIIRSIPAPPYKGSHLSTFSPPPPWYIMEERTYIFNPSVVNDTILFVNYTLRDPSTNTYLFTKELLLPQHATLMNLSISLKRENYTFPSPNLTLPYPNISYNYTHYADEEGRERVFFSIVLNKYYKDKVEVVKQANITIYYIPNTKLLNYSYFNNSLLLNIFSSHPQYFHINILLDKTTPLINDIAFLNEGINNLTYSLPPLHPGHHTIDIAAEDSASFSLFIKPKAYISEVMVDPKNESCEYVELYLPQKLNHLSFKEGKKQYELEGTYKGYVLLIKNKACLSNYSINNTYNNIISIPLSLNNRGENLSLIYEGEEIQKVFIKPRGCASNKGCSMSFCSSWLPSLPTPLKPNNCSTLPTKPFSFYFTDSLFLYGRDLSVGKLYLKSKNCSNKENVSFAYSLGGIKGKEKVEVGCSKTLYIPWNNSFKRGNSTLIINITHHNTTLSFSENISIIYAEEIPCNLSLSILLPSHIFKYDRSNKYFLFIKDSNCSHIKHPVRIKYWIEDLFGNVVKRAVTTTKELSCYTTITRTWNPPDLEGGRAYIIKAKILSPFCNNVNPLREREEIIGVKGPASSLTSLHASHTCSKNKKEEQQSKEKQERKTINIDIIETRQEGNKLISYVLIDNNLDEDVFGELYTYVYHRGRLISYGLKGQRKIRKWDANRKSVDILAGEGKAIRMENLLYNFKGTAVLKARFMYNNTRLDTTRSVNLFINSQSKETQNWRVICKPHKAYVKLIIMNDGSQTESFIIDRGDGVESLDVEPGKSESRVYFLDEIKIIKNNRTIKICKSLSTKQEIKRDRITGNLASHISNWFLKLIDKLRFW